MAKKNLDYHEYDVMTRFSLLSASDNLKKWSGFLATEPRVRVIESLGTIKNILFKQITGKTERK